MRRVVAAVGFLAIALSIAVGRTHLATGYEVDIYSGTPLLFWVLITFSMAAGMGLVLWEAFRPSQGNDWIYGFFIMVLGNLALSLLPAIRGYEMFGIGDSSGHVAFVRDMLQTGHVTPGNPYPVTHVLMWGLSQIGGVGLDPTAVRLAPLQTAVFMVSLYLFSSSVLEKREQVLFAAAGIPILSYAYYYVSVYPAGQAMFFLPFVLYLYFRGNDREGPVRNYKIFLIVSVPVVVFFHPAAELVLIAYLLLIEAAKAIWNWRMSLVQPLQKEQPALYVFLISLVTAFWWISSQLWFPGYLNNFATFLKGDIFQSGHLETIPSIVDSQSMTLFQTVFTALKRYANNIILLALAVAGCAVLFVLYRRRLLTSWRLLAVALVFAVGGPLWLFVFLGSGSMTLGRLLGDNPSLWVAPVLVGLLLYLMVSRARRKALAYGLAGALLLSTWVLAAMVVFPSPVIKRVNMQVTHAEVSGMEWFTAHNDPRYEIIIMGVTPPEESAVVGYTNSTVNRADARRWQFWRSIGVGGLGPDNFTYQRYSALGDWATGRSYILLSDRFRQGSTYPGFKSGVLEGFNTVAPWITAQDMAHLEQDPTVDRVYTNGGFDVFVIANTSYQ